MAQTSLTRTDSRNSLYSNLTPAASSSPLTAVTSVLAKANLTPQKAGTPPQPSPAVSTPGQWQHPRMDEVMKRQHATNFDASNVRVLGLNAAILLASFLLPMLAHSALPPSWLPTASPYYTTYPLHLIRLFALLNLALALTPLVRAPDACEDVPLTPAQRHRLGLPPMTRPATPQEESAWVTPPRYSPSGTPGSNSNSHSRAAGSESPLGGRGRGREGTPLQHSLRRSFSGSSPYSSHQPPHQPSPSPTPNPYSSPFRPPPTTSNSDHTRRTSLHSPPSAPSPAGPPFATPPKTGTKHASVGLNSKWLYERGRGSPRGSGGAGGFGTGFGGSGSVFC
ncbi:hypothetical protein LTR08_006142 [Meristemomyces frigidus]|nr:hypothetical protein LTR08_006142 [Meristemomyces frigidus]